MPLSTLNFRDLGGMRVRGGTLRPGRLYRSEGPAGFNAEQRAALADIGFRTICDLRSSQEQSSAPNDWADGVRILNFDIAADLRASGNSSLSLLRDDPTADGARAAMIATYRTMPAALLPHLPSLVEVLVENETPVLVHCTAGKDRTGVLIALLLRQLGAAEADIQEDYLRSDIFARKSGSNDILRKQLAHVLPPATADAILQAFLGVDPAYLAAMDESLGAQWDSIDDYFTAAGIDAARREALATALVEPER